MAGNSVYPWDGLKVPGDYFVVDAEVKNPSYMKAVVSNRNAMVKGQFRYTCAKLTYGCMVVLVQVRDERVETKFEVSPGISLRTRAQDGIYDHQEAEVEAQQPDIPPTVLTQAERVSLMSFDEKVANLPWWFDDRTEKLVWNGKVLTPEDADRYMGKVLPNKSTPYPEHYHLDENLRRKTHEQIMAEEDEDDEDWGPHPEYEGRPELEEGEG